MIVVMRNNAREADIHAVLGRLKENSLQGHLSHGAERTVIGVVGASIPAVLREDLERMEGVQEAIRITRPYKLATREFHPHNTVVDIAGVKIGGAACVVIA